MDEDRVQRMARAYVERGLSYAQIGEEFGGISRQRVAQLLGPLNLAKGKVSASQAARAQKLQSIYDSIVLGETTLEAAAERYGYSSGHSLRDAFYRLGLRFKRPIPPHGTRARYLSRKEPCRCEACTKANREHQKSLKGQEPPHHGYSGYINYGCRCQVCKEEHRVTMRARRATARRRKEVKL